MQAGPIPSNCFHPHELERFLALEGHTLEEVHYFTVKTPGMEFLYGLELLFGEGPTLLLTSGVDDPAIRLASAEQLVEAARAFVARGWPMHLREGSRSSLWMPLLGQALTAVLLSRSNEGYALNDALLLDFSGEGVRVQVGEQMGMVVGRS